MVLFKAFKNIKWTLSIVAATGIILLFFIDKWEMYQWQEKKEKELNNTLEIIKSELKSSVKRRFAALESLSSIFLLQEEVSSREFTRFASLILKHNPPIRALQYADSDTTVKYVYPPEGNRITIEKPRTLIADPKRGPYVKKAIEEKKATIQGPFELRQGGKGIVVRLPIFKNKKFIGLAIGVYDLPVLIEEAYKNYNFKDYAVELSANGEIFWKSGIIKGNSLTSHVNIRNLDWEIRAGWNSPQYPPLTTRILIWVLGLSFLAAVLVIIRNSRKKEEELEHMVSVKTEELKNIIKDKELLMGEMNHRVKNNLNLIDSFLGLKIMEMEKNTCKYILEDIKFRIKTIGSLHEVLYKTQKYDKTNLRIFAEKIIKSISDSMGNSRVNIKTDITDKSITTKNAITIGLILTELTTNAFKYAFDENDHGEIFIRIREMDEKYCELVFSDNGKGVDRDIINDDPGFGMKLLGMLIHQMHGSYEISGENGTSFWIKMTVNS